MTAKKPAKERPYDPRVPAEYQDAKPPAPEQPVAPEHPGKGPPEHAEGEPQRPPNQPGGPEPAATPTPAEPKRPR